MVVTCPLCAHRFNPKTATACRECPMGKGCDKICCPNCGYGWIRSSSVIGFILKRLKRESAPGSP